MGEARKSRTVKVTVSLPVLLQHAIELTKSREGEDRWERQARGLAELGYTIVGQSNETQWCVFYGGPDPDNCAGSEYSDEQAEVEESAQWLIESGVARRTVTYGPWEVYPSELAAEQLAEVTREVCGDRGPRIGSEGIAYCALPAGHVDPHRADESWGDHTWSTS